ncbi:MULTISPECIES: VOC family protein [unclassified Mesorhizobium]|uniref:VOC family protein n=1 Tax=unclassified Mesorhizobium TaxID=325217 RepID=UPI000FC995E5|nr:MULTISPECIES: VOC family protein [unclassified Mesorhizobium]RUV98264.1 glyoxalase [Mesorhizobium sp. M5C.F.Ca.IN.020.14.1.1]RUV31374.1 glyoxalase [Mesorhizobium sp. M5C.F.Ca.IN.020.32.2.1]RUV65115.1 glyoxalase [Mesorhizobium sp. M5C.F.Ca.IN.020.29.1.1]RWH43469.1 MAG: glyoxalase [Mesorhizobium sp.]RWH50144.1 MAG: glyoxalase [Mesorhizobium sp.]
MFSHVKFAHLPVRDQDRAIAFYRDKVGLKVATDAPYRDGLRWIELAVGESPTHLLFTERPDDTPGETPSAILITPDVGAAYERLTERGVEFTHPPSPAPWEPGATYALFRDSENNLIMLGSH